MPGRCPPPSDRRAAPSPAPGCARAAAGAGSPRPIPSTYSAAMGEEQIRDAYAAVTGRYIELFGTRERVPPDDLALIARHLTIRTGPVLDVGCGPGHLTAHLRSLGVDAT